MIHSKTRLVRGTSGQVFHRLFRKWDRRAYVWAMNLKPGDIINSYDCLNHRIDHIQCNWGPISLAYEKYDPNGDWDRSGLIPHGTFLRDVDIFTTDGMIHSISERGCIVPAYTVDQIKNYIGAESVEFMVRAGICDSQGIRLRTATPAERELLDKIPQTYGKMPQVYYPRS